MHDDLSTMAVALARRRDPDAQPMVRDPGAPISAPSIIWDTRAALGTVNAEVYDRKFWVEEPTGAPMITCPALHSLSSPADDILAWAANAPGAVFSLAGRVGIVGGSQVTLGAGPLLVERSVAEWAGNGGRGVVVLDWRYWGPELIRLGRTIRARTPEFAAKLRATLEKYRPAAPEVVVIQSSRNT